MFRWKEKKRGKKIRRKNRRIENRRKIFSTINVWMYRKGEERK